MSEKKKKKEFNPVYDYGEVVYVITNNQQLPAQVTGYIIEPNGILYRVEFGSGSTGSYYAFQLSLEKNYLGEQDPKSNPPDELDEEEDED